MSPSHSCEPNGPRYRTIWFPEAVTTSNPEPLAGTPEHRFWEPGCWIGDFSEEMTLADVAIIAVAKRDLPTRDTPEIRLAMMAELMAMYRTAFEAAIKAGDEARLSDVASWMDAAEQAIHHGLMLRWAAMKHPFPVTIDTPSVAPAAAS